MSELDNMTEEFLAVTSYHGSLELSFVRHKLGSAVAGQALQMQEITFNSLVNMSDEEYQRYRNSDHDFSLPEDSPLVQLGEAQAEFSHLASNLFGQVFGYRLSVAAAGVLSLSKGELFGPAGIERLAAELTGRRAVAVLKRAGGIDKITARGWSRNLPVHQEDHLIIIDSLQRLIEVNERIANNLG